jgi:hypothetical protein
MRIQRPKIRLSANEKRILKLICRLITEQDAGTNRIRNTSKDEIALSDEEAEKLVELLGKLFDSRDFLENSAFIKEVSVLGPQNEEKTRIIFNRIYRNRYRNPVAVNYRWYEIKARLGMGNELLTKEVYPLPSDQFWRMEKILFEDAELPPNATGMLIDLAQMQGQTLERLRANNETIVRISDDVKRLSSEIKRRKVASILNLGSVAFIIANTSVLFSTRDWTSAGIFSCMVGSAMGKKSG